jgi:hypothetical protein
MEDEGTAMFPNTTDISFVQFCKRPPFLHLFTNTPEYDPHTAQTKLEVLQTYQIFLSSRNLWRRKFMLRLRAEHAPISNTPSTGCSTPVPYNLQLSLLPASSVRCLWSGKIKLKGEKLYFRESHRKYSAFGKSLCTYKRCWKWCPRASSQAWTRLILFANNFCRSTFGNSLCTYYKRCWKWCPRASSQAWTRLISFANRNLNAQRLSERTLSTHTMNQLGWSEM